MNNYIKSASLKGSAFLFLFILSCGSLGAQNAEKLYTSTRDTLEARFKHIQQHPWLTEEVNDDNAKIVSTLENFLKQSDAFDYHFDLGKNLSDMVSEDKKVRIITWSLPPHFGVYRNFGYILYKDKKSKTAKFFKLTPQQEKVEKPETKVFNKDNWKDCVYYKLIQNKYKKKTWYTLLGWSGNDGITTTKLIEVLTFNQKGEPVFGAPIIQARKQKINRMIFEYNPSAVMTLNYEEKEKMIIYDHLSPSDPTLIGNFQYYGPDFSVDGLVFKKGLWILEEDLNAKNKN